MNQLTWTLANGSSLTWGNLYPAACDQIEADYAAYKADPANVPSVLQVVDANGNTLDAIDLSQVVGLSIQQQPTE